MCLDIHRYDSYMDQSFTDKQLLKEIASVNNQICDKFNCGYYIPKAHAVIGDITSGNSVSQSVLSTTIQTVLSDSTDFNSDVDSILEIIDSCKFPYGVFFIGLVAKNIRIASEVSEVF